ncbi:MAG TPA: sensor histidine kinase, partial [Candidatus Dormibacteraeota bacterium]|nr:sensor histidine kinase [Candidatus Dormibacteraeota bacterium]
SVATAALAIANSKSLPNLDAADPIAIVVPIGLGTVGALVASRRPRNATGWLFLAAALVSALGGAADQYARLGLVSHPGSVPGAVWALWFNSWSLSLVFPTGAVALLLLLLPDGRLPSRRWRPVAAVAVLLTGAFLFIGVFAPGPLTPQTSAGWTSTPSNPTGLAALSGLFANGGSGGLEVVWPLGLVVLVVAGSAPLVRMRRSAGDERQQLKWIAYAVFATALVCLPLGVLTGSVLPNWAFDPAIIAGFGVALPAAAGVAILKHRLYDIDVVISRTLVYGSLAVFITAVYVGIAVGIGALVGGGGKPNLGLSILATAIVAVGFQPVRERVQRVANRLVYGERATPYEVLSQFSERVAESYATDDVMPRMARVLAEGTGAQRADVWLRSGSVWRDAAVWPVDAAAFASIPADDGNLPASGGGDRVVEVRHQGELLGALSVSKRAGESLTPVEESLLSHLAHQAGLVVKNVGLTSDLQARLVDLRASRQRLVTAQDEERRRLERNLHDGAQQHLVALKVKLGLAEMLLDRDPVKAQTTLIQLKADADEALETLRDLARGIYPPLLADKGLTAALESQARKAIVEVAVHGEGIGRYSQEVEAAVYFSVLEAMQNVQKYAGATKVIVRLREEADGLAFAVEDDGCGFDLATVSRGSGLTNMEDRLDALGGSLQVVSSIGQGTSLHGWLAITSHGALTAAASG